MIVAKLRRMRSLAQAALIHRLLGSQPWSAEMFEALADHMPLIAIEAIVVREGKIGYSGTDVLLLPRPSNDLRWPNMWHSPGSIVQADETYEQTLDRIAQNEVAGRFRSTKLFAMRQLLGVGRANVTQLMYRCEIDGHPTHGGWHDANRLPEKLVETQEPMLLAVTGQMSAEQMKAHDIVLFGEVAD